MSDFTTNAVMWIAIGGMVLMYAIFSLLSGELLLGRRGQFRIGGVAGQLLSVVYALIGVGLILNGLIKVMGGFDEETEAIISAVSCLGGIVAIVISIIVIIINVLFGERKPARRR